jgi:tetratricopeptide (TPR) repeat protein
MNRYEEAIRDFNAAEAAAPRMNWDVIALRRARCLAALNRFDEATRDLDRIPDNDGPFTRNRDELWEWISRRR